MGRVTFDIKTNRESVKRIKRSLFEYCTDKDYPLRMHEKRGELTSEIDVAIDVPDSDMTNVLKVFKIWGSYLYPM